MADEADGLDFVQDDAEIDLMVTTAATGPALTYRFQDGTTNTPPAVPPTEMEILLALDAAMTGHSQLARCQKRAIYAWFTARFGGLE